MKMHPIIAVVDEDTFHALNDHISGATPVPPAMAELMRSNGWTIDAMCAGAIIKSALEQGIERECPVCEPGEYVCRACRP